jgi:transcriptional regulator with XRE-family HTH domain
MKVVFDTEHKNIVGPYLKLARISSRYTQQELSNKLEIEAIYIDRASISKIENQKRIVTDYELVGLAKVLNISIYSLLPPIS